MLGDELYDLDNLCIRRDLANMQDTLEPSPESREWIEFLSEGIKQRKSKLSLPELARCVPIAFQRNSKSATREEKLAQALARGVPVRQQMALEEGGSVSAEEAARILGITKQAALAQYHAGKLLGFRTEKQNALRFPLWQFAGSGRLPGLGEVLQRLNEPHILDDWAKIGFFLQAHRLSKGKRPLDCLRNGDIKEALRIADAFVE